eukprot:c21120_g5_i1 orf=2-622(-)
MCFDLVLRPVENCSVAHSSERHLTVVPNFYKGQEGKPAYLSTFSTQGWKSSDTLGYFKGSDNQKTKTNPEPPDVKHKITQESWKHSPCWVQEELSRGQLYSTEGEDGNEVLGLEKEKNTKKIQCLMEESKEEEEEEVLVAINDSQLQEAEGNTGDSINLVALLKTYAKQKDLQRGSKIHAHLLKRGLLEKNVFVASALVNMYVKCGA